MNNSALNFGQTYHIENQLLFADYNQPGVYSVLSTQLVLARQSDGGPGFKLRFVSGRNPLLPPRPYCSFDLHLDSNLPLDSALAYVRKKNPGASVRRVCAKRALLALYVRKPGETTQVSLEGPHALHWNGSGVGSLYCRTTPEVGSLIEQALDSEVMTIEGHAAVEVSGIASRINASVTFDRKEMAGFLAGHVDTSGLIEWSKLAVLFKDNSNAAPITWRGAAALHEDQSVADAFTDHVVRRMGEFDLIASTALGPSFRPLTPGDSPAGQISLDLTVKTQVTRVFHLAMHPINQALALISSVPKEQLVSRVIVEPINTGRFSVTIHANLPTVRKGVFLLGAELRAAPHPPGRMHEIKCEMLFNEGDSITEKLRFSPNEAVEYTITPFAIIRNSDGSMERIAGKAIKSDSDQVHLQPDDFPVHFFHIECSRSLLQIARVALIYQATSETTHEESVDFTEEMTEFALATQTVDPEATIRVVVEDLLRESKLTLGPVTLQSLRIDLTSFPEYGPHEIDINCVLDHNSSSAAIEIRAEDTRAESDDISVLRFTVDQPARKFSWFADSIFSPGYCYRFYRAPDQEQLPWSEPQSAFESLQIQETSVSSDRVEM